MESTATTVYGMSDDLRSTHRSTAKRWKEVPGMSPPNMAHAHRCEEGQRPILSLPRSLVRLLVGPVVPFDVQLPGYNSEPTCFLKPSNFYPAVSLLLEVERVAGVPCSAHHVMCNRHLLVTENPSGAKRARGGCQRPKCGRPKVAVDKK